MNKLKDLIENGCRDFICKRDEILIPDARMVNGRTEDTKQECDKLWVNLSYLASDESIGKYIYGFPVRIHKLNDSITVRLLVTKSKDYSNITKLRKKKGLTQEQLSVFSGVNIKTIQKYEQNEEAATTAQVDNLRALAKVLGCKLDELIMTAQNTWPLDELFLDDDMLESLDILKDKVKNCRLITIGGSTGSGKTTLAQSLVINYLEDADVVYDNNVAIIVNAAVLGRQDASLFITLRYCDGKRYIESISEVVDSSKSDVLYLRNRE